MLFSWIEEFSPFTTFRSRFFPFLEVISKYPPISMAAKTARYNASSPEETEMFLTKTAKVPKIAIERINCRRALLMLELEFIVVLHNYW